MKILKDSLLRALDNVCGWTKGPAKLHSARWWNDDVDKAIKEKRRLWKEWKSGGDKEKYLIAKRTA